MFNAMKVCFTVSSEKNVFKHTNMNYYSYLRNQNDKSTMCILRSRLLWQCTALRYTYTHTKILHNSKQTGWAGGYIAVDMPAIPAAV